MAYDAHTLAGNALAKTGTGTTYTLGAALTNKLSIAAVFTNGASGLFCVSNGTSFEDFVGTVDTVAGTVTRTLLLESSTGSAINWSGTQSIVNGQSGKRSVASLTGPLQMTALGEALAIAADAAAARSAIGSPSLATNSGNVASNASLVVTHAADSTGVRNCWVQKTTGLTSLLLPCNGSNGSTSFPDSSGYAHSVTASGAQVATASAMFGTGGALFTTSSYLSVPDHTSLTFGSGDFMVEFWLKLTDLTAYRNIIDKGYYVSSGWLLMTQPTTGAMTFFTSGGTTVCQESMPIVAGTWYHYRVCRIGTTVTIARNGSLTASGSSSVNFSSTTPLRIGANSTYHLIGSLDDIHIVKGYTGVTSGFSAPSAETTALSGTKAAVPIVESTGGVVVTHTSDTQTTITNKTGTAADLLAVVSA